MNWAQQARWIEYNIDEQKKFFFFQFYIFLKFLKEVVLKTSHKSTLQRPNVTHANKSRIKKIEKIQILISYFFYRVCCKRKFSISLKLLGSVQ